MREFTSADFEMTEGKSDKEMAVIYAADAMLAEYAQCWKEVNDEENS
jgi:hypothetical protein